MTPDSTPENRQNACVSEMWPFESQYSVDASLVSTSTLCEVSIFLLPDLLQQKKTH